MKVRVKRVVEEYVELPTYRDVIKHMQRNGSPTKSPYSVGDIVVVTDYATLTKGSCGIIVDINPKALYCDIKVHFMNSNGVVYDHLMSYEEVRLATDSDLDATTN